MAKVFERPKSLIDIPMHYCPGYAWNCSSSGGGNNG